MDLKENTLNNIPAGSVIFSANSPADHICAILKGSVEMSAEGIRHILKSGSMLGIADAYRGVYEYTYTATEDALLYVFPVKGEDGMKLFLEKFVDYRGISVASMSRLVTTLNVIKTKMTVATSSLSTSLSGIYEFYKAVAMDEALEFSDIEKLEAPEFEWDIDDNELLCRAEMAQLPVETHKYFYEQCVNLAASENEKMSKLIEEIMGDCRLLFEYAKTMFEIAVNRDKTSLLDIAVSQVVSSNKEGISKDLSEHFHDAKNILIKLDDTIEENTGERVLNREKLEELIEQISDEGFEKRQEEASNEAAKKELIIQNRVDSLTSSLERILKFAELDESKEAVFKNGIEFLVESADRMEVSDEMRQKKHALTPIFYQIYKNCFKKSITEDKVPYAVELLLSYGFVDERLLSEDKLRALCSIEEDDYSGEYNIYTAREWLELIYSGAKNPSRDNFSEDYFESMRTKKKNGELTDKQIEELTDDMEKRLEFEIDNMFASNMKVVNGQISSFAPVLYDDTFFSGLEKARVKKQAIADVIDKYRAIDYSVFSHEYQYNNPEFEIKNETVYQEVTPDIILLPVYGTTSSMWQEIDGRNKLSPGRVLFPAFTETAMDDLVVGFMGRYRWEYTRCVQGVYWNDITNKSLTSEYSDYIQYYRKNRELSESNREKVKLQIQKARNSLREIFAQDYSTWIRFEYNGSMRLNKVVREMLATYCPFDAEARKRLMQSPAFSDAFARYEREATKDMQRILLKVRAIEAKGQKAPKELTAKMNLYSVNLE